MIRPFAESDIPQVVAMNGRLFPGSSALSGGEQERRFREICFKNPWHDAEVSSLVSEGSDGTIGGFIAIIPRRMKFRGRDIRMAVSQHLMVDPGSRSSLVAVELIRRLLAGPQDLTVADMSTDLSRTLWERLGGSTALLYSLHWVKPLKPFTYLTSKLGKRSSGKLLTIGTKPFAAMLDRAANRLLNAAPPGMSGFSYEPLTTDLYISGFSELYDEYTLRPAYDENSLKWLFEVLGRERRFGTFDCKLVRDPSGRRLGWFIYFHNAAGPSHVLQICAGETTFGAVLDALFAHAAERGAVELTGRMEPRFMKRFAEKQCLFIPGRSWVLVSSKDPELVNSFFRGEAFFSRIEGDPWFF